MPNDHNFFIEEIGVIRGSGAINGFSNSHGRLPDLPTYLPKLADGVRRDVCGDVANILDKNIAHAGRRQYLDEPQNQYREFIVRDEVFPPAVRNDPKKKIALRHVPHHEDCRYDNQARARINKEPWNQLRL